MDVKLVVTKGKHAGRVVPVAGPKFFIGRAPECHLRSGSDLIGRHHCVILVRDGFVAVRDFGTTTGTCVNDEAVRGQQELKAGDRLAVGPLEFEVQFAVPHSGVRKPTIEEIPEESPDGSSADIDEKVMEKKRRRSKIVGVSEEAQARRTADTPRDAASDALGRFFTGRR